MTHNVSPLTGQGAIKKALQDAEKGDELTIEDDNGTRINETVTGTSEKLFDFGPVDTPRHHLVDVNKARLCKLTGDPINPVSRGTKIVKVWVWS